MEKICTLCGGKLVNGICSGCGLDNTKDDKKYNLNMHNDGTLRFHSDDCEVHLNRPSIQSKVMSTAQGAKRITTAGTAAAAKTSAARRKQLNERRKTGTVQKKRGGIWVILLVLFLILASWFVQTIGTEMSYGGNFYTYIAREFGIGPYAEYYNFDFD